MRRRERGRGGGGRGDGGGRNDGSNVIFSTVKKLMKWNIIIERKYF